MYIARDTGNRVVKMGEVGRDWEEPGGGGGGRRESSVKNVNIPRKHILLIVRINLLRKRAI